jgi:hypothetical protein
MVFAPAIGIAAFQVLGWLCAGVSGLLILLVAKQFVAPNAELQMNSVLLNALVFACLSLACFWAAKKVRQAARGE